MKHIFHEIWNFIHPRMKCNDEKKVGWINNSLFHAIDCYLLRCISAATLYYFIKSRINEYWQTNK